MVTPPERLIKAIKAIDVSLSLIFVMLTCLWFQSCSLVRSVDRVTDELQKGRYSIERARTP